jgi:hypothetical protein
VALSPQGGRDSSSGPACRPLFLSHFSSPLGVFNTTPLHNSKKPKLGGVWSTCLRSPLCLPLTSQHAACLLHLAPPSSTLLSLCSSLPPPAFLRALFSLPVTSQPAACFNHHLAHPPSARSSQPASPHACSLIDSARRSQACRCLHRSGASIRIVIMDSRSACRNCSLPVFLHLSGQLRVLRPSCSGCLSPNRAALSRPPGLLLLSPMWLLHLKLKLKQ